MHHTSLMNTIKGGDQGPESPENYFLCSGVRGEEGGKKEAEPIENFWQTGCNSRMNAKMGYKMVPGTTGRIRK